jgi:hypothetical protein
VRFDLSVLELLFTIIRSLKIMSHYVHKINVKKADMSKMLPTDAHTCVNTYEIYPDGTVRADAQIVKVCKKSGKIKGHLNIATEHDTYKWAVVM